ncbi:MAG: TIM-barrel domain-containing protein [Pleomorphochaeta sp.]
MLYLEKSIVSKETVNSLQILKLDIYEKSIAFTINKEKGLWGFGERFDKLNQKGLNRSNHVYEKFTNQGEETYLPIPFFLTNDFGVFINTDKVFEIESKLYEGFNTINIFININQEDVYILLGDPKKQLNKFLSLNEEVILPPKWSFGPWMSANRWNSQDIVLEMAKKNKELGFNHSVIVVEAWSDEATFYKFNDKELWPNPKEMINSLNKMGLNLVLWQIPVLKKLEKGRKNFIHEKDCKYAIENNLVVKNNDGTPYTIPNDRWFEGSMIPDFTNPKTQKWWFKNRQYLLDMGVKGFKTDGGEFIYKDDVVFFDGSTGNEMKNKYPLSYTKAYYDNLGEDRILFSRAGYTNSWSTPLYWGGDQLSKWSELKHQLIAGLNASVSGIFYWGFDIAGFAGEMPSKDLYLRAFLLGTFSPVMQWHSEPIGGQFSKIMKSKDSVNDRSPWNIADLYNDDSILTITKNCCNLRNKMLDYIYSEAEFSKKHKEPLMRPLFFEHSNDKKVFDIDDEYYFGRSLLVAPIVEKDIYKRKIYLPKGNWFDCQLKKEIKGNIYIEREYSLSEIGLFVNLDSDYSKLKNILIN